MRPFRPISTAGLYIVGMGGTMREHSSSLLALKEALQAAERAGATTKLFDLRDLDLPMFQPGKPLEEYDPQVGEFIEAVRQADGLIWSTAAYHGTLAGITKNAIDFLQHLSAVRESYLDGKAVGLIATAGGDMAGVNAVNTMVQSVHSLRGTVVPFMVAIPKAWQTINPQEDFLEPKWQERLVQLGQMVAGTAARLKVASDEMMI